MDKKQNIFKQWKFVFVSKFLWIKQYLLRFYGCFFLCTGGGIMAPPLLPFLLGSLARQLSRTVQYASVTYLSGVGAHRCISTITAALVQARGSLQGQIHPFRAQLLGQNQQFVALQPAMGMKTKTALKKRCKDCFFVRRRGRLCVFCKSHPRHKQRQGWIFRSFSDHWISLIIKLCVTWKINFMMSFFLDNFRFY